MVGAAVKFCVPENLPPRSLAVARRFIWIRNGDAENGKIGNSISSYMVDGINWNPIDGIREWIVLPQSHKHIANIFENVYIPIEAKEHTLPFRFILNIDTTGDRQATFSKTKRDCTAENNTVKNIVRETT